jgi:hypothetical protein
MNADEIYETDLSRMLEVLQRVSAVISTGECNTSDLIMGEEVLKWQREAERVCLMSRRQNCGQGGRRVNA